MTRSQVKKAASKAAKRAPAAAAAAADLPGKPKAAQAAGGADDGGLSSAEATAVALGVAAGDEQEPWVAAEGSSTSGEMVERGDGEVC